MNKYVKYAIFGVMGIMTLAACSPKPRVLTEGDHTDAARKNFQKYDSVIDYGVREISPGIFVRKFTIGYDVVYMRVNADGSPVGPSETTIYTSGKAVVQKTMI